LVENGAIVSYEILEEDAHGNVTDLRLRMFPVVSNTALSLAASLWRRMSRSSEPVDL
jgi:hypothetical protein